MLRPIQEIFDPADFPELIAGLGAPDDAAVWEIGEGRTLIVTTDFFTPVVDSPFDYGSIAAANALSDLYAMGSAPIFALNILAVPASLPADVVSEILRGGAEKVKEAGAVIAGGHSIQDDEPKYGLVAVGLGTTNTTMTKGAARPGDILVLSKPLGLGVTTTALKNDKAKTEDVEQAVYWMNRLNADAAKLAIEHEIIAATDITGFGLLGHGLEMAESSGVELQVYAQSVPFLKGARAYAEAGNFPGGSVDNKLFFGDRVEFSPTIDEYNQLMLFDAQTSGGLLLAIPEDKVQSFFKSAGAAQSAMWAIGRVRKGSGITVEDTKHNLPLPVESEDEDLWFSAQ